MTDSLASIFKAYDIRGKVGNQLTPDLCRDIGRASADFFPEQGPVAVGRDMRPDSLELSNAVIDGLRMQGRTVWDIGEVTSDMIYFAVGKFDLAGGIVVTASHNPGEYNGLKIYRDNVTPVGLDGGLDKIRDAALSGKFNSKSKKLGNVELHNIDKIWIEHCLKFIDTSKWPEYKLAIDAGNGMAGAILPDIIKNLPVVVMPLYFEVDGNFPNHEPNPQKLENLKDLINLVKKKKLDLGIAFDGDGDRAVLVDDKGRHVHGADMLTLVAQYYLKIFKGAEIVHDVRTSKGAQELIKEWGGTPVRAKAGRVHVGAVVRQRGAPFGGETTGHLFFKDNYDADSGLIGALVAIQAFSESGYNRLSELIDSFKRYAMMPEMNFETTNGLDILARLREEFKSVRQDEFDGLSVFMKQGWFNLRVSNTEPVVRLNAEALNKAELAKIIDRIKKVIEG